MSAGNDETIRLGLDASGYQAGAKAAVKATQDVETAAQRAEKRLAELQAELRDLEGAYSRGAVQADVYAKAKSRIERGLRDAGAAAESSAKGLQVNGQAMMQLGRIVQDAQYGFAGVVNNLESMAMALGAGAGVAGAAQLAGVAFSLLSPYLKDALGSLTGSDGLVSEFDRLSKKIKTLEDAGPLDFSRSMELAAAKKELTEFNNGLAEFLRLRGLLTTDQQKAAAQQKEAGKALETALTDAVGGGAGYAKLTDAMKAQQVQKSLATDPLAIAAQEEKRAATEKLAEVQRTVMDPDVQQRQIARQEARIASADDTLAKIEKQAIERVGDAFRKAFEGDAGGQQQLQGMLGDVGRKDLAAGVGNFATDKFVARKAAEEARAKAEEERAAAEQARQDDIGAMANAAGEKDIRDLQDQDRERVRQEQEQKREQDREQERLDRERQRQLDQDKRDRFQGIIARGGGIDSSVQLMLAMRDRKGLTEEQAKMVATLDAARFAASPMGGNLAAPQAMEFGRFAADQAARAATMRGEFNDNKATEQNTKATEQLTAEIAGMRQRGVPIGRRGAGR